MIVYLEFMSDRSNAIDQGDLLSDMLDKLRFHGDPGINGAFTAPWGFAFDADHNQAPFYVIASGTCWLDVKDVGEWELHQGDLVLLPRGDAHHLKDAPGSRVIPAPLPISTPGQGMQALGLGGGGRETQIISGFFRFESPFSLPILGAMEPVILLGVGGDTLLEGIAPLLGLFCREGHSQGPGTRAATAGLLKLLFIEILRTTMSNRARGNQTCNKNPLALLFDPVLRKAAEAIHFESDKAWTVATLAKIAGLSRTSFAVRFQELTGTSPLAYLTQIRMLDAIGLLERTNDTLEGIALQVGYGSEAAFSTAFKREMGISPGGYRKEKSIRISAEMPVTTSR